MTLSEKLKRPYYLESSLQKRAGLSFLFGLFIFLFLLLFKPFGLNQVPGIAAIALGYGLCTSLVMLFVYALVPIILPGLFNDEKWNIMRQIIWTLAIVSLIGLANAFYSVHAGIAPDHTGTYLWYFIYTFLVGIFPVAISVILNERSQARKFLHASENLNRELQKTPEEIPLSSEVHIPSENKNEELRLALSELRYIRASDNYIEVYFMAKDELQKKLIRNSLKNISLALSSHPTLFRCHKSYLVNMSQVTHVSGNAQGYRIQLAGSPESIPVSRSLNSELKSRLIR